MDGTANINASLETQASLMGERPDVFSVSPRVGKSGWVTVVLAEVRADELRFLGGGEVAIAGHHRETLNVAVGALGE